MSQADDFLVEIGTEEMPPKALRALMEAFAAGLAAAIDEAPLAHGDVHAYASPRRLAVIVTDLARQQASRTIEQKGPPVSIAFDKDNKPTAAATAFAKKCGVSVDQLSRQKTGKGEWLRLRHEEPGRRAAELMPEIVERALDSLPIPRRMRWGAGDAEFVRPVHWVVLLHGNDIVEARLWESTAAIRRSAIAFTHRARWSSRRRLTISTPGKKGLRDCRFRAAPQQVQSGVEAAALTAGGTVVDGDSLYDEVTALVEWPVPVLGSFDQSYLTLPREVVMSTLTGHQRYFPVADDDGELLPRFITVANLESKEPDSGA